MAKNDLNNRQSIEGRNLSGNNEIKGSSELIFLDSWSIVFGHNCNVEDSNWTSDKSKFKCRLELFNPQAIDAAKVRRLNSNMSICTVPRNSQNVDGVKINQTNHSKALGLNVDKSLSWKEHLHTAQFRKTSLPVSVHLCESDILFPCTLI